MQTVFFTSLTFLTTAFNIGYCVYKPNPFNVGMAVFTGLWSLYLIFRREERDRDCR